MGCPKLKRSPEDLFTEALNQEGPKLSGKDLRLLTSGMMALRGEVAAKTGLNNYEMKAVQGMIAYVATTQKVSEMTVSSITAAAFQVNALEALTPDRFDAVMAFLFDFKIKNLMN